jgi:Flp pilus assembly protein TadD
VQGAIDHLTIALSIYPSFVAAHTALGSAYMGLGRSDQARAEFARLARYFGTSEQFWLNLQDTFAVHQVKKKYSRELKAIKPLAATASR